MFVRFDQFLLQMMVQQLLIAGAGKQLPERFDSHLIEDVFRSCVRFVLEEILDLFWIIRRQENDHR